MAVYQVDIEKSYAPTAGTTIYWTNVYYVNAADSAAATTSGQSIVTLEKTIHSSLVSFTKMRIRQPSVLSQAGTIVVLTGTGSRATTQPLPLFNVFRIDFSVASGRPNRKYIRGPVLAGDNNSGAVLSTTATTIVNSYITPLINMNVVVDKQGQPILTGALYPFVGMRQLRRGSKRKIAPVI